MKYTIYTDGSDFKRTNHRLGIGGLVISEDSKLLDTYSSEISLEYMKFKYQTEDCSNPTMELLAALECLKAFKGIPKKGDSIVLKADYIGVSKWLDPVKPWKTTKPYIARVKAEIMEVLRKDYLGIPVDFAWIPAHQKGTSGDPYWNNLVDKLAKGEKL